MCFYNSTNNDLIEAKFFFLILRVKSWGVVGRGGGGTVAEGEEHVLNGWRLF